MILTFALASTLIVAQEPEPPARAEAERALRDAVEFFHWRASTYGGYVWRYSSDLTYRRGEAVVGETTLWVQPPGTPAVGMAILDAHEATGDPYLLDAAVDAGRALCRGQMRSGGWYYSIEFEPSKRPGFDYRENPEPVTRGDRTARMTTLDDNTTQAATQLLVRLDEALEFEDAKIHEAAGYALEALLRAQHPNGGFWVWWVEYPEPPTEAEYPVLPASFPEEWLREWPNTWTGRYVTNDNLVSDMITTFLLAHRVYDDDRYLDAARRCGDFLILAQMPDPQPAWAQQYNVEMHPEWSRKFEPPAISGGESQTILRSLIDLYDATGDAKYLEPIPRAVDYLRSSLLPDGRLARFYELQTNKPLYFTTDYKLTYSSDDMPTHYGFIVDARLDRIESEYRRRREGGPRPAAAGSPPPRLTAGVIADGRAAIDALDERGAWVEEAENGSPVLESSTFADRVRDLATFIRAAGGADRRD